MILSVTMASNPQDSPVVHQSLTFVEEIDYSEIEELSVNMSGHMYCFCCKQDCDITELSTGRGEGCIWCCVERAMAEHIRGG